MNIKNLIKMCAVCFVVASGCINLAAQEQKQEVASPTPYLFARSDAGVTELEQSWDGKILYAAWPYNPDNPSNSSFWNVSTRQKLPSALTVGFTFHNKTLSANGGFYCVLDIESNKRVRLQNEKELSIWPAHRFSSDGTRLTLAEGGFVSTWDTQSGKQLNRAHYDATPLSINDVGLTLSPDGSLLAAISKGMDETGNSEFQLRLIDAQTGVNLVDLPKLQYHHIGFSPDSRIFWALSSHDFYKNTLVRFWDARSGKLLWSTKENCRVHFSPDSQFYGAPRKEDFAIYEARTGRIVRRLSGPTSYNCTAWNFSFNGENIWSANRDGSIWQRHTK